MSIPPEKRPPLPRAPLLVRLLRFAVLSFIGLSSLALLLAGAIVAARLAIDGRIVPGVSIGEVDIGGMTSAQAAEALAARYGNLDDVAYNFRYGGKIWTARAAELGLRFPADELLERAYAIGRGADAPASLRQQADAWFNGATVPLSLRFDEAEARAYLEGLAREIDRERQDASLQINGLRVAISPGHSGRKLDRAATLLNLRELILAQADEREIALLVEESPPRASNVEAAAALAQVALSAPLQLIGTRPNGELLPPWIVTPEQIRAGLALTMRDDGGDRRYDVSVDLSAHARFLATLSPQLSVGTADGRFDFDPASGQLSVISPSSGGRRLNVEATIKRLEAAVFDPLNRRVEMVFDALEPRYPNDLSAADLGITELVAESTTYYWGSWPNRRSNIALGAGKLHGIIVAPGEEFSFNQHLGDITPQAGYLEGSVILGGATVTGIGGGICQVSTTMFRAAFSGGYAITERNSHGYRVGYYEYAGAGPGLDAAIWQPDVDLRFQNNSPWHLLIESSFLDAQDALQFRIYSTRHWHTVIESAIISDIVPAPAEKYVESSDLYAGQIRQIDYSADGADVRVYRNVYGKDGSLIKRDQLFTHYSPWQAVFEVAPGDPRLIEEDEEEEAQDGELAPVGSR